MGTRRYPNDPAGMGDAVKAWLALPGPLSDRKLRGALLRYDVIDLNDLYAVDHLNSRVFGVLRLRFGTRTLQIDTRGHAEDV